MSDIYHRITRSQFFKAVAITGAGLVSGCEREDMVSFLYGVDQKNDMGTLFTKDTIAGLELWFKADSGISLSGMDVIGWADQSGHGRNLNTNWGSWPDYYNNVQNGEPGIYFNGNQTLRSSGVSYSLLQPYTIVIVSMPTSTASQYVSVVSTNGNALVGTYMGFNNNIGTMRAFVYSGTDAYVTPTSISSNTPIIQIGIYNSSTSKYYENNGMAIEFDPGGGTSTAEIIIGGRYDSEYRFTGYVFEVMIYNKGLTQTEIREITGYLNDKYAVF